MRANIEVIFELKKYLGEKRPEHKTVELEIKISNKSSLQNISFSDVVSNFR